MNYNINYKELFNLNVLHKYFLDVGENSFDDTVNPVPFSKEKASQYISIEPSIATQKRIKGYRLGIKTTPHGVACFLQTVDRKPKIDLTGAKLDFLIRITDPLFQKYTDLDHSTKGLYFFPFNSGVALPQINTVDETATEIETYKVLYSSNDYTTYTADLAAEEQVNLFGLVSIQLDELLDPVTVDEETVNEVADDPKVLKILLKNRTTVWRYLTQSGSIDFETIALPFVKNGSITPVDGDGNEKNYPMASPLDVFVYSADKTEIITEIYI